MQVDGQFFRVSLATEVEAYSTPHFALRDDLEKLGRVLKAGAAEASVLYCARILEVLAHDAMQRVGQDPSANLFSNLQLLEHVNRIGAATRYWAHALRRLGNVIRHVNLRVIEDDAAAASAFLWRCMHWFFCEFSHGPRLPTLTGAGCRIDLNLDSDLLRQMQLLEEVDRASQADWSSMRFDFAAISGVRSPVLRGVWAEMLLARSELDRAREVLESGLTEHPEDVRLRQLLGLYYSRSGRLDLAVAYLEALPEGFRENEESIGILAGAYKRMWLADRMNSDWLERAERAYRTGWKSSGRTNVYLGINAATMALFRGDATAAAQLAGDVERLLRRRMSSLPAELRGVGSAFSYWDQVTVAEARLLQGDRQGAEEMYAAACSAHAGRSADIQVALRQRAEIEQVLQTFGPCPRPPSSD